MILINDKNYESYSSNLKLTVLQFCSLINIDIPRFCYHEKLSIAGNCRMCLVEDSKSVKPVASCAINLMSDMSIYTNSAKVKKAREGVLEFLLINHPLDCPICDQGGECDLQDEALVFGSDRGRFYDYKRAVEDKNCGPLVKTIMNRCIHCTRCVRFSTEIAGISTLGITGRGSRMEIGFYISNLLNSEVSGNIIDLCPVGALTSKPYSFTARPWELKSFYSIDIFDTLLSNIRIDVRGNEVMRVLPRINPYLNEEWISDKIRFCYDSLQLQRLYSPMIRYFIEYVKVSWYKSFCFVKDYIINILQYLAINKLRYFAIYGIAGSLVDTKSLFIFNNFLQKIGYVSPDYKFSGYNNDFFFNKMDLPKKVCIFYNVNLRYISPVMNIFVRQSYLKHQTLFYYIGSNIVFNYYVKQLGNSSKHLILILSGKHWLCHKILLQKEASIFFTEENIKEKNIIDTIKVKQCKEIGSIIKTNLVYTTSMILSQSLLQGEFVQFPVSFYKNTLLYLLGNDTLYAKLYCSNTNLIIYQGHHGDYGCYFADVIFPSTTFFEKDAEYLDLSGNYKNTFKALSMLIFIRDDNEIIKALGAFLGLTNQAVYRFKDCVWSLYKQNFYYLQQVNTLNCFLLFSFIKDFLYYRDNALVASSKTLSLASNIFSNNFYNYRMIK